MNRYRWVWLAVAALTASAWLWSQRYEYIACPSDEYCILANRFTGEVGLVPSKMQVAQWRAKYSDAKVDSLLRDFMP